MKRIFGIVCLALAVLTAGAKKVKEQPQQWPDGTVIDSWFQQTQKVDVSTLGKQYVLTDYGVMAGWPRVQTKEIQTVIDRCAQEGGVSLSFRRALSSAERCSSGRAPICISRKGPC